MKPLSEKGQPLQFFEKNTQYFVLEDVKEAVEKLKGKLIYINGNHRRKNEEIINKIFGEFK